MVQHRLEQSSRSSGPADSNISAGWSKHQTALAAWVSARLVNRSDASGRYWKKPDGSVCPFTCKKPVDWKRVTRHFTASGPDDILGLHAIGLDGLSKWVSLDIDFHSREESAEDPESLAQRNRRYAIAKHDLLVSLGFKVLLWSSNGKGGYHLDILFTTPIPSQVAYRFGRWLVRDWKEAGFEDEPEAYPRAPERKTEYQGNWLRIVGRHPKRDYWAHVYAGGEWVEGEAAVLSVLSHVGNNPELIPPESLVETVEERQEAVKAVERVERHKRYIEHAERSGLPINGKLRVGDWLKDHSRSFNERRPGRYVLDVCPFNEEHVDSAAVMQSDDGTLSFRCHHNSCRQYQWQDAKAVIGKPRHDHYEWPDEGDVDISGITGNPDDAPLEPEWESLPVVTVKPSTKPVLPMEDIRSEMLESRLWSIGNPGIYLDRSGTGTGKSRQSVEACAEAVKRGQQVLYVAPVHANADEIVGMMVDAGIVDAGKYPQRVYSHPDAGTDLSEVTGNPADDHRQEPVGNCWNESADLAQSLGLSVMSAVCPRCPLREKCQAVGYQHELNGIRGRSAVVATHARGAFQTLNDLGAGREFIVIDEDPVDVLKPMDRADIHYLPKAVDLLREILDDPKELDMIGTATNGGDQYGYLMHLLSVSEQISAAVESATTLAVVELPAGWVNSDGKTGVPPGIQMRLLKNCRQRKKMVTIWRILLAAASGSLSRLVVSFDRKRRGRGAGGEWNMVTVKSLVGVWSNQPPVSATTWLQDGTADPEIVKACLVGRSVVDLTPEAVPPSKYPVVQVPQDISRETSANVVVATLRGLLADRPGVSNVGVVCHSTHRKDVEAFKGTDGRIGRVTYFGSGLDVASNVWTAEEHDLLVILGTPRPGEAAIRGLLLQMGDVEAAGNVEPGWEPYRWSGWTQSREPVGVESRRYADPVWQRAYQAVCRSQILQAVGRGRGACDNGLPVLVVSGENCGLPVTDAAVCKMNATESLVLKELVRLSDERINDYLNRTQMHSNTRKEKGSDSLHVRTGDVSQAVGVSTRKTLNYLKSLERRGLIVHKGKSGWLPVRVAVEPEPVSQVVNEPESSKEPVFQPLDEKPDAQDAVCQPVTGGDDLRVIHKNDASKVLPVKIAGGLHTQPQSQQFLLSAEGVFDGKIYATTGYAQDGS